MSLFCKHKWKEVVKDIIPSALDNIRADNSSWTPAEIPHSGLRRKYIYILTCEKCGKLYKTVEETV